MYMSKFFKKMPVFFEKFYLKFIIGQKFKCLQEVHSQFKRNVKLQKTSQPYTPVTKLRYSDNPCTLSILKNM
jgi:hypothetical protein